MFWNFLHVMWKVQHLHLLMWKLLMCFTLKKMWGFYTCKIHMWKFYICKSHFHVSCIKKTNKTMTFLFVWKSSVRKQSHAVTIFYHKLYHKSKSLFSLPHKIKVKCSKPSAIQNKPKHYLSTFSYTSEDDRTTLGRNQPCWCPCLNLKSWIAYNWRNIIQPLILSCGA